MISRKTSMGIAYNFRRVELETTGTEDFQSLSFSVAHDFSKKVRAEMRVGGYKRSTENAESETRVLVTANVRFNQGLTLGPVRFDFSVGVIPSNGGALTGTAVNATGGVSISGVRTYPLNWRVGAVYNRRSPFGSDEPTTDTLRFTAGVEPSISRLMGLRFVAAHAQQTSEDPARDARYARVSVNLVVYPLGGKRVAGRKRRA